MSEKINSDKKNNVKKAKGPIRFEAIIPLTIILVLPALYFSLFFDHHVKWAIEKYGTKFLGGEVKVESFKTSFTDGLMDIKGVSLKSEDGKVKRLGIGEWKFHFSWDGLLRGKFIVNEASIEGIEFGVPLEKTVTVSKSNGPLSLVVSDLYASPDLNKVASSTLQNEYQGNVLGDLAQIIEGDDPLKALELTDDDLESLKRAKSAEELVKQKEEQWKTRVQGLPNKSSLEDFNNKIKALKDKKLKNPQEIISAIEEANKLIKEIEQKKKSVTEASAALKIDVDFVQTEVKEIERLAKEDYARVASKVKIPDLDVSGLATQLFRNYLIAYLGPNYKYVEMALEYMPAPKEKDEGKEFTTHPRKHGVDYRFGKKKALPLFWFKTIKISSTTKYSENSGNIKGVFTDITSDQNVAGVPTKIALSGDFPKSKILGFKSEIVLDHRRIARDDIRIQVNSFPIENLIFVDGKGVRFGIKESTGSLLVAGPIIEGYMDLQLGVKAAANKYDIEAKSNFLKGVLEAASAKADPLTIDSKLKGQLTSLDMQVKSNIASAIKDGVSIAVEQKIADAKKKLQAKFDAKLDGPKKLLTEGLSKFAGKYSGDLASLEGVLDKNQKGAADFITEAKNKNMNKAEEKLEESGKKALKGLKKKFKF